MGAAAIAVPLALGALNIGAQVYGNTQNQRFLERQADRQEQLNRRAAIENALGSFGSKPLFRRTPGVMTPPDLTGSTIAGGIANLGMAMMPQFLNALNGSSMPDVTVPPSEGLFPTTGMGQYFGGP